MKKWAIPLAAAGLIAVIAAAGAAFALTDSGDDGGPRAFRDVNDRDDSAVEVSDSDCAAPPCEDIGGNPAAICLQGAIDCDDTRSTPPAGEVCIDIYPRPPECDPEKPAGSDPGEPVGNEPGVPPIGDPGAPADATPIEACTMEYPNKCTATAAANADLAGRLGIAEDQITVKSVEFVEWPDTCLGIARPDVVCATVITPGYRILFEATGRTYEYHTDGGSRALLVE
jgi:hypothetical protein